MIDPLNLYLMNLAVVLFFMCCVWPFSVIKKDVSIVDIFWGLGFVIVAWNTFVHTDGYLPRKILVATLTTVWGLRLALHIYSRSLGKEEDPRYRALRAKIGEKYWIVSFFTVFGLQAVILWIISLSVQVPQTYSNPKELVWTDFLGTIIWIVGFTFEAVADHQLKRFRADSSNRGKVMDRGLWAYSRHPNYFGESMVWWGMFLISLTEFRNVWVIVSPALITYLLLKVSGVTLLEKTIVETKPKYKNYIQRTNAFLPWLPRKNIHQGMD